MAITVAEKSGGKRYYPKNFMAYLGFKKYLGSFECAGNKYDAYWAQTEEIGNPLITLATNNAAGHQSEAFVTIKDGMGAPWCCAITLVALAWGDTAVPEPHKPLDSLPLPNGIGENEPVAF